MSSPAQKAQAARKAATRKRTGYVEPAQKVADAVANATGVPTYAVPQGRSVLGNKWVWLGAAVGVGGLVYFFAMRKKK